MATFRPFLPLMLFMSLVLFPASGAFATRTARALPVYTLVTAAGGYLGDNGPAVLAVLYHPNDVAVDARGNIYIPNPEGKPHYEHKIGPRRYRLGPSGRIYIHGGERVYKVTPERIHRTVAGVGPWISNVPSETGFGQLAQSTEGLNPLPCYDSET